MPLARYVKLESRTLDLLALGINSVVLGASTFFFTLAAMSFAQVESSPRAALYAGLMSAGLRVSTYLMAKLGLNGHGSTENKR